MKQILIRVFDIGKKGSKVIKIPRILYLEIYNLIKNLGNLVYFPTKKCDKAAWGSGSGKQNYYEKWYNVIYEEYLKLSKTKMKEKEIVMKLANTFYRTQTRMRGIIKKMKGA